MPLILESQTPEDELSSLLIKTKNEYFCGPASHGFDAGPLFSAPHKEELKRRIIAFVRMMDVLPKSGVLSS